VRVYLVRHAQAASGEPDDLRPLTESGREQARALGERLAALDPRPAVVLTSPLLRARETAAAIAKAIGAELRVDERLAPGATAASLAEAVEGAPEPVVAVGHQPDCSEIAVAAGAADPGFPPGAMAELELPA
jgi:phosphohistidine phosphatase SixA